MGTSIKLSQKNENYRDFVLNGNLWKVIFSVCTPLVVFQAINQVFMLIDLMMAAHISAESVSAVAWISQIQVIIDGVGTALAIGGGIKISESFGSGDSEALRKRLNTLILIGFVVAIPILIMIPFSSVILRITSTPESFIKIGSKYFMVLLFSSVVNLFNNIYISIERSRGNTKRIMILNISMVVIKTSLSAFFIYGINSDVTMIAVATLIGYVVYFFCGLFNLSKNDDEVFKLDLKAGKLKKEYILPILKISYPIAIEKTAFAFGKALVNSMSKVFGDIVVGALNVSDRINANVTSLQSAFQDGGVSIISQNKGNGKMNRVLEIFRNLLIINVTIGIIGWILLSIFVDPLATLFSKSSQEYNQAFEELIKMIQFYNALGGCIPLGVTNTIMALLFGMGYTKLTLIINFCRIFVFRVPVLWFLTNYTNYGKVSVGITTAVSNISTMVLAIVIAIFVILHIKRNLYNN